ncbi:MAG: hypothetical protein ACI3ZQ_11845 [Candidatus Cryptobacteroides sp.]
MTDKYDDIINLPHHVSPTRQAMSLYDRAAQFSSFSALTGLDDVLDQAEESYMTTMVSNQNRPAK